MYRTLIRVEGIEDNCLKVILPSWDRTQIVNLPIALLPSCLLAKLKMGLKPGDKAWIIGRANTGADRAEDLMFSHIEPSPSFESDLEPWDVPV